MKVLIIHNAGSSRVPSGELNVVRNEVEALKKRDIECNLHIVYNDDIDSYLRYLSTGVNIIWSNKSFQLVAELIKNNNPDIVHFHSILPILTPSVFYACKSKGIPVIQTLHNFRWLCVEGGLFRNNNYCEDCLGKGMIRGILKKCSKNSLLVSLLLTVSNTLYVKRRSLFNLVDTFIAVSTFVKDTHVRAGFPEDRLVVNYNGIDMNKFSGRNIDAMKKKGITFVGRLTPAKGTGILKRIVQKFNDTPFNIVGDGPDYTLLKTYCAEENYKKVKFWGRVDSSIIPEILSGSSCVVIPSVCGETFGLVAAEAMACGTPVVASKIGGLREIVEQSGGGVTVNPVDSGEFVPAIRSIIKSPEKILELGNAGRDFVERHLTLKHSVNRLVDIYIDVMAKKRIN